ncbi:hypothetical protein QFZ58_006287 [Streptomyces sp. B1I3]|nr:hypothetical protein [Streptomyces sp. B1I3]MDQ0797799.1 hypothetical protein [Streptomyces sp. B1I3]
MVAFFSAGWNRPAHVTSPWVARMRSRSSFSAFVVVLHVDAEDVERLGVGAAARRDLGMTVRDQVELGEVLVETDGVEHAQDRDGAGQGDKGSFGGDGGGGEDDCGRGHREPECAVFIDTEHVEPCLVCEGADVHDVADSLRAGVTRDHVGEGEDAEFDLGTHRDGALHIFDGRQPIGT